MPVHQQAGADVGVGIDMRFEVRVRRDVARLVVVEVAHLHARFEQSVQRVAVLRQRDIEHQHVIPAAGIDPLEQADVPLGPGDQGRLAGECQPHLVEGAYAIGVAVEYVKLHVSP